MKIRRTIITVVLSLVFGNRVSAVGPAAPGTADAVFADVASFQHDTSVGAPAEIKDDPTALHAWAASRQAKLTLMRFEAAQHFPEDPRHWSPLLDAAWTGTMNPKSLQAYAQAQPEAVAEVESLLKWAGPALSTIEKEPSVPVEIVATLRARRCSIAIGELEAADFHGKKPEWQKIATTLDEIAERSPGFRRTFLEQRFAKLLNSFDATAAESRLQRLIDDPKSSEDLRKMARTELAATAALRKPIELAFTAVDGREVDVSKLRGKVVLVDFWATWCGPCVAELPNVKKVYAAYHEKGFEVVGISLDAAASKQKLVDFVTKEAMPWPQYFDGKFWQNAIAVRFAINAIPAMFLLDQEGQVVSTNARGERLEAEVKRLLKL